MKTNWFQPRYLLEFSFHSIILSHMHLCFSPHSTKCRNSGGCLPTRGSGFQREGNQVHFWKFFFSSYGRCLSDLLMYILWIFLLVARTAPHPNMRWIVYQVRRLQPTVFYGYASPFFIWVLKRGEGFEPRQTAWAGAKWSLFNSLWLVETLTVFICCDRRAYGYMITNCILISTDTLRYDGCNSSIRLQGFYLFLFTFTGNPGSRHFHIIPTTGLLTRFPACASSNAYGIFWF